MRYKWGGAVGVIPRRPGIYVLATHLLSVLALNRWSRQKVTPGETGMYRQAESHLD